LIEGVGRSLIGIAPMRGKPLPSWEFGLFGAKIGGQLSPNPATDRFRAMVEKALKLRAK
jgi:hypothetical protein